MSDRRFRIAHPDGREYDVTTAAFRALYEPEGFAIVANADGTALEQPRAARAPLTREQRSANARKGHARRRATAEAAQAASEQSLGSEN